MRVAIIGTGKTGSKVVDLLKGQNPGVFNSQNPPKLDLLKNYDVIICFTPGDIFVKMIDLLVESHLPCIIGSTGFDFPKGLNNKLINQQIKWVYASNFSLGMNLIKDMLMVLQSSRLLFPTCTFKLHEVHHTKKKDIPSGTSKTWMNWLEENISITSERIGDVIGKHTLTLDTGNELIKLEHEALDRKVFAEGALWAAHELVYDQNIPYGINEFSTLVKNKIQREKK